MPKKENDLDLGAVIKEERFQGVAEDLVRARQENDTEEAKLDRRIKFSAFVIGMLVASLMLLACLYIILFVPDPDQKKWAQDFIAPIVTGIIGFAVGKGKNEKS